MLYLISYDIRDDKKRYNLHKLLKNYGQRNQFSVFECDITEKEYVKLKYEIDKYKIEAGDSVMIYPLCYNCKEKIIRKGLFKPLDPNNLIF